MRKRTRPPTEKESTAELLKRELSISCLLNPNYKELVLCDSVQGCLSFSFSRVLTLGLLHRQSRLNFVLANSHPLGSAPLGALQHWAASMKAVFIQSSVRCHAVEEQCVSCAAQAGMNYEPMCQKHMSPAGT